jgi:CMP-N,N'-diacetyllegionaminic acid synthase
MKILALIPARGGSKRLPGKNINLLGGKPLISWTIEVAKQVPDVVDILVSTDDLEIATISVKAGAFVPWLRPPDLATDTASSVDVAIHAIDWYEVNIGQVDGLLLLQPTSPFRTAASVQKGIDIFAKNSLASVVGVSPAAVHPLWCLKYSGDRLIPFFEENGFNNRSQDMPEAFVVNGGFYLISPNILRSKKSFFVDEIIPLFIDSLTESIDIDTVQDWDYAESTLRAILNK